MAARRAGTVERAVRRELAAAGIKPADSGLAAAALAIARRLDEADSTSGAAAANRELRATLKELGSAAPTARTDGLDELQARRKARRGG